MVGFESPVRGVLLSGGLDSTALAAWLHPQRAFVVDYGQVCARAERIASQAVAHALNIPITVVGVNCASIGSGDLSGTPSIEGVSPSCEWWPYRNQLLATLVAPLALQQGVTELLFATVQSDSFHKDGTSEFFQKLDDVLRMQEGQLRISAPVIGYSTVELIKLAGVGLELLGWTHSCHTGNEPCGRCRGCVKRASVLWQSKLLE